MDKFERFSKDNYAISKALLILITICALSIMMGAVIKAYASDAQEKMIYDIVNEINSQTETVSITYENGEINVQEIVQDQTYYSHPKIASESHMIAVESETIITTEETASEEVTESTEEITISEDSAVVEEDVEAPYAWFGPYSDIGDSSGVTAEMLDACTEYYSRYQSFENKFIGKGSTFIKAQEQSGIDALWLYAVSVYESGWGTSDLAINKSNYYGIAAWDTDITKAKVMGDSFDSGIINGAIWIRDHYYSKGMTSMTAMNSTPNHSYAPGNTIWIPTITEFINTFIYNWRN